MWPFSYIAYCFKRLFNSNVGIIIFVVLMVYFVRSGMLWRIVRKILETLSLFRRRSTPLSFGGDGLSSGQLDGGRAAWELRKDCVGVYSIQGRRPHMEDRFNVVELEQIDTSIYGVFDGHGGQVTFAYNM